MADSAVYIYCLRDPRTRQARYVGKTTVPRRRECRHATERGHTIRHRWVDELREVGLRPVMDILEETTKRDWPGRERYWIQALRFVGAPLLNLSRGGQGATGLIPSEETRLKLRVAMKRYHKEHPMSRARIDKSLKAMLAARRGSRNTPEHNAAISAANTGRPMPDHVRKAIREGCQRMVSHAHSAETRCKIGLALSGEGNGMSKLTWPQVHEIRRRYAAGGISLSTLGREYGVDTKQIHRIVRNEAWVEQ